MASSDAPHLFVSFFFEAGSIALSAFRVDRQIARGAQFSQYGVCLLVSEVAAAAADVRPGPGWWCCCAATEYGRRS